jgi:hypothetical protein
MPRTEGVTLAGNAFGPGRAVALASWVSHLDGLARMASQ